MHVRALQAPAQQAWAGSSRNVAAAQQAFLKRAQLNALAHSAQYSPALERSA